MSANRVAWFVCAALFVAAVATFAALVVVEYRHPGTVGLATAIVTEHLEATR